MIRPSSEYTIHILEDEDFDVLPVGDPREAIGMSDPKRKIAWVRRTHVQELDIATINHEFDELMQGTSLHEIDGIRYKSGKGWGKIFGPVVGTIVGVLTGNPALGFAVGAGISGGTAAHTQSKKPEKYGKPTFTSIGGSALGGGAGAYGGASLINAGRVAATNAAIAGGTGNTAATLGAGLKGATGAALSTLGGTATVSGGKSILAPTPTVPERIGQPAPNTGYTAPSTLSFNPFTPTGSKTSETGIGPLSDLEYKQGLSNIDLNLSNRMGNLGQLFKGQTESENSAFGKQATATRTSSSKIREDFIRQQSKAKGLPGFI